jgi:hypothetical protein
VPASSSRTRWGAQRWSQQPQHRSLRLLGYPGLAVEDLSAVVTRIVAPPTVLQSGLDPGGVDSLNSSLLTSAAALGFVGVCSSAVRWP